MTNIEPTISEAQYAEWHHEFYETYTKIMTIIGLKDKIEPSCDSYSWAWFTYLADFAEPIERVRHYIGNRHFEDLQEVEAITNVALFDPETDCFCGPETVQEMYLEVVK